MLQLCRYKLCALQETCSLKFLAMSKSVFVRGNTYLVEIPNGERAPTIEPATARIQNRTCRKEKTLGLEGRTYEEVVREAARIQLGGGFQSFLEFDRCLNSWAVIHCRSVARYKTSQRIAIRNCRFGKNHKHSSGKDVGHCGNPEGSNLGASVDSGDPDCNWESEENMATGKEAEGADDNSGMSESDDDQENWCPALTEQQV